MKSYYKPLIFLISIVFVSCDLANFVIKGSNFRIDYEVNIQNNILTVNNDTLILTITIPENVKTSKGNNLYLDGEIFCEISKSLNMRRCVDGSCEKEDFLVNFKEFEILKDRGFQDFNGSVIQVNWNKIDKMYQARIGLIPRKEGIYILRDASGTAIDCSQKGMVGEYSLSSDFNIKKRGNELIPKGLLKNQFPFNELNDNPQLDKQKKQIMGYFAFKVSE